MNTDNNNSNSGEVKSFTVLSDNEIAQMNVNDRVAYYRQLTEHYKAEERRAMQIAIAETEKALNDKVQPIVENFVGKIGKGIASLSDAEKVAFVRLAQREMVRLAPVPAPTVKADGSGKPGRKVAPEIQEHREKTVRAMLAEGKTGNEICATLRFSIGTLQNLKKSMGLVSAR